MGHVDVVRGNSADGMNSSVCFTVPWIVTQVKVHPRLKRDTMGISTKREDPLTRSDFLLDSRQWSSLIVGKISEVTTVLCSS